MGFEFPSLNRTSHDLTTGEQDKGLVAMES